jgi:hypothetical protein
MIDRKEFVEELKLREGVRAAIKAVLKRRERAALLEQKNEEILRVFIRDMLQEGTAVATTAKHNSTGINALEDLLKNTNVLSTIETGYKTLTTDKQQRDSYRNHILDAVQRSLAPEEERKLASDDIVDEEVDIEIGDNVPENDPAFIDVEEEEVEEEPDEREEFGLEGEDKTGRNRAFTDFKDIEKVILTAFDDLDNQNDIDLFTEYLIKNLSLYFDKFEAELDVNVEAPAAATDAVANMGSADTREDDDDVAPLELQEIAKLLDIDDIIENLL